MIRSFAGKNAVLIWEGRFTKRIDPTIQRVVLRKLGILRAAKDLNNLKIPPGNRLETLIGDRAGQYSIRGNSQ